MNILAITEDRKKTINLVLYGEEIYKLKMLFETVIDKNKNYQGISIKTSSFYIRLINGFSASIYIHEYLSDYTNEETVSFIMDFIDEGSFSDDDDFNKQITGNNISNIEEQTDSYVEVFSDYFIITSVNDNDIQKSIRIPFSFLEEIIVRYELEKYGKFVIDRYVKDVKHFIINESLYYKTINDEEEEILFCSADSRDFISFNYKEFGKAVVIKNVIIFRDRNIEIKSVL